MTEVSSRVDLRSDTVTRPSEAMRAAIAAAEVGDDVLGDDPTVAELQRTVAELLGKEAALYFPSGTMANQAAILILSRPGTRILADPEAHVIHYEEAAAAAWGGVQVASFESRNGVPEVDSIRAMLAGRSRFTPEISLVTVENTHNRAGGRIVPVNVMEEVAAATRAADVGFHLDGARLPNAAVAGSREMSDWAKLADTVTISLSKGLGAPVGSVLAGSSEVIDRAWRVRRRLGGGMRQAGLIAAGGLFALENNLPLLADDHRRAADLAERVAGIDGLTALRPETNIVMIDIDADRGTAAEAVVRLEARGILLTSFGSQRLRAVTHLDVDDTGVDRAVAALQDLFTGGARS